MRPEQELENHCVKLAEKLGWVSRKMSYIGRRGCRDRDFYRGGKVLMVEFKAPGERPKRDQVQEHAVLAGVGITIHVIDNEEDFMRLIHDPYLPPAPDPDF